MIFRNYFAKEIRRQILDFKFQLSIVLMLLFFPTSVWLKTIEYKKKEIQYHLDAQKWLQLPRYPYYDQIRCVLIRPPSPLSVFCKENGVFLGNQFLTGGTGMSFEFIHDSIGGGIVDNFRKLDPIQLALFLLMLFALFLTYDAISGERELGTLELQMSYSLSRKTVLLSKHLAVCLMLFIPFVMSLAVSLFLILYIQGISFGTDDWFRLLFLSLLVFLVLSFFCWLGILFSVLFNSSSSSLIGCLYVLIFLSIIYPNVSRWMARSLCPVKTPPAGNVFVTGYGGPTEKDKLERANQENKEFINRLLEQYQMLIHLSILSPSELFYHSSSAVLQEDPLAYNDFFKQALLYNDRLISWQNKMTDRFPSKRRISRQDKLDLKDMPVFQFQRTSLGNKWQVHILYLGILIFFNIVCFLLCFIKFLRFDPRSKKT